MRPGRSFWTGAVTGAVVAAVVVLAATMALVGGGGTAASPAQVRASATPAASTATASATPTEAPTPAPTVPATRSGAGHAVVTLADGTQLTVQQAAQRIQQLQGLDAFAPYLACAPMLSGSLDAAVSCMRSVQQYTSP